jgi:hypothetical protein
LADVDFQTFVALVALAWLIVVCLVMARSVHRGRELATALAQRHPETYEALGRPRPGYFDSVRRDRFARFVAKREFEQLGDPVLASRFEEHRKSEARLVIAILASMAVVALLVFVARRVA